MSSIIRMTSKEFLKDFIKDHNPMAYNLILVSEDIKSKGKFGNVHVLPTLIPKPSVLKELITKGDANAYFDKYFKQLEAKNCDMYITILVKLALVDDADVIIMCSETEDEYGYLRAITDYIEQCYLVKTCSYKKYKKNPEKCKIKKSKKAVKNVMKRFEAYRNIKKGNGQVTLKDIRKKLADLSKDDLRDLAKNQGIKVKNMRRKDIIEAIIDRM